MLGAPTPRRLACHWFKTRHVGSWGAARRFTLKPRKKVPAADAVALELYLGDGDLLVMGGACQQTHVHGVPKRRKKDEGAPGRRISWTFRQFKAPGESAPRKRKR